ncbi:M20/M25/M40 family metallo-hydrolase [Siphonobacter sp. SORGH_AS_1065]|uniref:M20/M25/M40 family metallo-hydrolase n=1 Tax=Siphonobacter sp. SORGH_AS_1065 TaxID=3041795 RepID=UPI00278B5A96|nr:M20/M25/M40 family metallo-hydrolase [Siphonobacter sp. SORGH_AS_1065]MDQ1086443.1 acetylornithine deacetylase/succinyl-diaminopimelate desuccinylase-like protein [Siphonobacter sp. SORGH_AS_1065]
MKKWFLCLWALFSIPTLFAQTPAKVRAYRQQNEQALLQEYFKFLSIPNILLDTTNDVRKNAFFIQDLMKRMKIPVQLLELDAKTPPVVFGEVKTPGATQTLLFYAHYDGQPTNPSKWAKGTAPFKPVLATNSIENGGKILSEAETRGKLSPEYRIIARSATDDKAGVFAILSAYEALLKSGIKPTYNLKFFFEGEEENGSQHLGEYLTKYKNLLDGDCWIFCDGPVHQSGNKIIVFGCRGDINVEIATYGPRRPLHSGHYGNWAPNPAMRLAKLLSSMKDDSGRVLIKGFYDDVTPLSESEKKAIAAIPPVEKEVQKELGIGQTDGAGKTLAELINEPSLNINGIVSAGVGAQAANVIPSTAVATLDLRVVAGNDPHKQVQKLINHVKAQGYYVTDKEPTMEELLNYPLVARVKPLKGYRAQRTPLDLPIAQKVVKAVQSTTKDPIVIMPSLGGSLPLYLFSDILQQKAIITVPIANYDSNQHGENENIRLQNLWDGIESMASIMTM